MPDKYDLKLDLLTEKNRKLIDPTIMVGSKEVDIPDNIADVASRMFAEEIVGHARIDEKYKNLHVDRNVSGRDGLATYFVELQEQMGIGIDYSNISTEQIITEARQMLPWQYREQMDAFLLNGDDEVLDTLKSLTREKAIGQVKEKARTLVDELKYGEQVDLWKQFQLNAAFSSLKSAGTHYVSNPNALKNAHQPLNGVDEYTGQLMHPQGAIGGTPNSDKIFNQPQYN